MCNKKSALAWKIVNEVSGINNSNRAKHIANSRKERIQLWNDHFKELFGKPSIPTANDESTMYFSRVIIQLNMSPPILVNSELIK